MKTEITVNKKIKTVFFCSNCGQQAPKWLGRCPTCGEWNTFVEEELQSDSACKTSEFRLNGVPQSIEAIEAKDGERLLTGIAELDRVLGGGIVGGSAVLIGGDPGIGKSTLLLQVLEKLAEKGLPVLYVSGEESARQIKLRGKRLGAAAKDLLILVEVELESILARLSEVKPAVAVIDSIQTIYSTAFSSAPGSVGQVREAAGKLILFAKKTGIPIFLVGHVTKDGSIAGPKILEHMVDTVLYFEGDSGHAYRIVRCIKNRFGPTHEIGVFEMRDTGLAEVANPSAFFLAERPEGVAGSIVVPSMEGSRPILVEVQSLVSATSFGMPRRTAIGVDHNRVSLLTAVMDKICGIHVANSDIFLNVAGGVKIDETATDLGIVAAIASSFLNRPIAAGTVVFGEVGLTGEIRGVSQTEFRIKEAARMGFKRCIFPGNRQPEVMSSDKPRIGIELIPIRSLGELIESIF
ncbi:MAG: DNA repair protein RadA [Syntrophales bacterium]